jgi:predicted phosphodiesterase
MTLPLVPLSLVDRILARRPLDASRRAVADSTDDDRVLQSPRDALAACLQSYLAESDQRLSADYYLRRGVQFDERDIDGWIGSFFSWFAGLKKHAWIVPSLDPTPIDDDAKIALFADWGTGLYGAPLVTQAITDQACDVAIHLGDVYYSGTHREFRERVVPYWPHVPLTRACNGNHEMYTGGDGYFDFLRDTLEQESSCFLLMNDRYLIVGLDTAYDDHAIDEAQAGWLDAAIDAYAVDDARTVIVLSHHQPWSAFEDVSPALYAQTRAQPIDTWYWGHEHKVLIYNVHPVTGCYGRCIGHGGYPSKRIGTAGWGQDIGRGWWAFPPLRTAFTGGMLLDRPSVDLGGDYNDHGFAVLELGDELTETIYTAGGEPVWSSQRTRKG